MATWKKILTEADKATDAASGIANGETGLATGNAVYDYIVAQNFGSGSGDITSVVVGSDSGSVGAATGNANFTIAGGTNVTTAGSGSTLTVNATAVHLAAADQTLANSRAIDCDGNDLEIDPNGGVFSVNDSSGSPTVPEIEVGQGNVDLNGVVRIHSLTYPSSDGSSGQFLKTNGSGTLSFGTVSTSDEDVSVSNLETRLGQINSNVTIGNGTGVGVTISGNLTVNGTTTTVNSTQLTIDDKIITAASGSVSASAAGTAGLEIDTSNGTQLPFVGFVDGAGLTEMVVKAEGNTTAFPISIMEFGSTASTAPSGNAGGVGSFHFNTTDDKLYIRTA